MSTKPEGSRAGRSHTSVRPVGGSAYCDRQLDHCSAGSAFEISLEENHDSVTENASSMPSKRRQATQAGHDTLKVRDFSELSDFKSEPIRTVTKIYDNLLFRFMDACSAVAGRPRLHSLSRESELQK